MRRVGCVFAVVFVCFVADSDAVEEAKQMLKAAKEAQHKAKVGSRKV